MLLRFNLIHPVVAGLKLFVSELCFLGKAGGILMMLVSRRGPGHPASSGEEGRGEAEEAPGGEKRPSQGRP